MRERQCNINVKRQRLPCLSPDHGIDEKAGAKFVEAEKDEDWGRIERSVNVSTVVRKKIAR